MIKESTITKLTEMHLGTMAESYRMQLNDKEFRNLMC